MHPDHLIVFSGLPGVGKTTISRLLAIATGAVLLRVDSIEHAMRQVPKAALVGNESYLIAAAIARDNLNKSRSVIIDAVNDDAWCHALWIGLAAETQTRLFAIEVICSDLVEHQRRVEHRKQDLSGHPLPDWQAVQARDVEAWPMKATVIDSATQSPDASAKQIEAALRRSS